MAAWSASVAQTLPNGTHHRMAGEWHGVPDENLAPALTGFLLA